MALTLVVTDTGCAALFGVLSEAWPSNPKALFHRLNLCGFEWPGSGISLARPRVL